MLKTRRNSDGFAFVELIVVLLSIALIGLAGLAIYHYHSKPVAKQAAMTSKMPPTKTVSNSNVATILNNCTPMKPLSGVTVETTYSNGYKRCNINAGVGDELVIDAVGIKYNDGTYGYSSTAQSGNVQILASVVTPADSGCNSASSTCSAFKALKPGSTTIMWSGPSGCHDGICVSAAIQRFYVTVKQ